MVLTIAYRLLFCTQMLCVYSVKPFVIGSTSFFSSFIWISNWLPPIVDIVKHRICGIWIWFNPINSTHCNVYWDRDTLSLSFSFFYQTSDNNWPIDVKRKAPIHTCILYIVDEDTNKANGGSIGMWTKPILASPIIESCMNRADFNR